MFEKLLGIGYAMAEGASGAAPAAAGTADAAAAAEGAAATPSALVMLVQFAPLVLLFVVFWFVLIRPQRKKDKQVKEMLNNLKAGDRVCTIGGIYGTITGIKDDTVTLSVGRDNLTMVIARWGIRSVEEVTIENDAKELN